MAQKLAKKSGDLIQHDTRIGNVSAENDDLFLFDCFVDSVALSRALDTTTTGLIVAGRTGSGKTAILKYVERHKNNARIAPSEMALQYISNSEIMRFLNDIGADLDIFFQTIWKHVLCIEYIRLRYQITDSKTSISWYRKLCDLLGGDEKQKRALGYLKDWEGQFWITIDENVRQITQKYENALNAEIGIDISKLKSKAGYGRNLSVDQKTELVSRARTVISSDQLSDLSRVLDLLKEQEGANYYQDPCYILIDDLDDRWIDDSLKYRMIRALVESLKSFSKIQKLKILVALRTDVLERVMQENKDQGFQREKYNDFIFEMRWSESELKEMVNKRISFLYKRKYTKQNVRFEDLFPDQIKGDRTFKYLLDRTLWRPRDIIAFVNACLEKAENNVLISPNHVSEGEKTYSAQRYDALLDEWRTAYPTLEKIISFFKGKKESQEFRELAVPEIIEEIALPICTEARIARDPMWPLASAVFDDNKIRAVGAFNKFASEMVSLLYRVGAIGVKEDSTNPFIFAYKDAPILPPTRINDGAKLRVVKMLHSALHINSGGHSGRR